MDTAEPQRLQQLLNPRRELPPPPPRLRFCDEKKKKKKKKLLYRYPTPTSTTTTTTTVVQPAPSSYSSRSQDLAKTAITAVCRCCLHQREKVVEEVLRRER